MHFFTEKHRIATMVTATSVASVLLTVMNQGQAKAITLCNGVGSCTYDYLGQTYDIDTLTGTYNDLSSQLTDTTHNFWWGGNPSLAQNVAGIISNNLGLPNSGGAVSPLVAYDVSFSPFGVPAIDSFFYFSNTSTINPDSFNPGVSYTYAYATVQRPTKTAPEPSGIIGGLFASLAAGAGVVARRKLALAHKIDAASITVE
jgi:hypothetical protein